MKNFTLLFAYLLLFLTVEAQDTLFEQSLQMKVQEFQTHLDTLQDDTSQAYQVELKHFKKFSDFYEPRLGDHGDFSVMRNSLRALAQNQPPEYTGATDWHELGPFRQPDGSISANNAGSKIGTGPVNFVAFDPNFTNNGLMFTGGWNCGLFVSYDGGSSWSVAGTDKLIADISAADCKSLTVPSGQGELSAWIMLTGYGDGLYDNGVSMASQRCEGVYLTTNSGEDWVLIGDEQILNDGNQWIPWQMKEVLIHPESTDDDFIFYATSNKGIWKCSLDINNPSGATWELVYGVDLFGSNPPVDSEGYTLTETWGYNIGFVHDPTSSCGGCSKIIASVSERLEKNGQVKTQSEVLISDPLDPDNVGDQGTWTKITSIPTEMRAKDRIAIDLSKANKQLVFCLGDNETDSDNDVFRYNLATDTWLHLGSEPELAVSGIANSCGISSSPNDEDLLYVVNWNYSGGPGITKYEISGQSTTRTTINNYNNYHDDVEDIAFTPDGSALFLATHGGVYSMNATTESWEANNNGLGIAEVLGFSTGTKREGGDKMLVGLFHDGTKRSEGNVTETWEPTWFHVMGGDGQRTMINSNDPLLMYGSSQGSIFRKSNNGFTSTGTQSLIGGESSEWKTSGVLSYQDPNVVFVARENVYRHDNQGTNITSEWVNLTGYQNNENSYRLFNSTASDQLLFNFYFDDDNGTEVRKLALTNKAMSSTDLTENDWIDIPYPQEILNVWSNGTWVSDVQSDPLNPNVFYVVTSVYLPDSQDGLSIVKYTFTGGDITSVNLSNYDESDFQMVDFTSDFPDTYINRLHINPGTYEFWAACDLGVYYTNNSLLSDSDPNNWYTYGGNIPNCTVQSMEVNWNFNKIRVGTYGRGVWENKLPCDKINSPFVVADGETLTLDQTYRFRQDVIVEDNAVLKITGTVFFAESCGIIVEPGGEVEVDGGHLTSACKDALWKGIEVNGQDHLSQWSGDQGWAWLKNNAVIENAHTGVWLRKNDNQCDYVEGSGGGVVRASNTTFLNCYVGAEFEPYIWYDPNGNPHANESSFTNCEFITTRKLNKSNGIQTAPRAGLIFKDNFQIKVRGCTFNNIAAEDPNSPEYDAWFNTPSRRGIGIESHNTVFSVKDYCTQVNIYNECTGTWVNNEFKNLTEGIFADGYDLMSTFEVKGATFSGNVVGIRAEGLEVGPSIVDNDFEMIELHDLDNDTTGNYDEVVGIDIDGTTGFEIEENKFVGQDDGNLPQAFIGVAFTATGLNSNELYRNEFDNLTYGNYMQKINGGEDNGFIKGLQVRCNDFGQNSSNAKNSWDVYLSEPFETDQLEMILTTISPEQGSYDMTESNPAANLFSHNCTNGDETDLYVDPANNPNFYPQQTFDNTSDFTYVHTSDMVSTPAEDCYSDNFIYLDPVPDSYDESQMCPTNLSSGGTGMGPSMLMAYSDNFDILEDTHDMYVDSLDRGDTRGLIDFINNPANSSIQVRNEMIACVPYISDRAWEAAFKRNPALNEWHISQVLLQASPLDKSVIKMMNVSGLDPYYKELVEDGQNGGMTHKMILENDMATYRLAAEKLKNDYLRQRILWDTSGYAMDSLEYFYSTVSRENEYIHLAALETKKGNYSQALSLLGTCQVNRKQDDECMVQKIITESKQAGNFCPAFSSKQESDLLAIANNEKSPAYARARSVLRRHDLGTWNIDIRITPPTRSMQLDEDGKSRIKSLVEVHPNPASGEAFFTSKIPEGVQSARIVLTDSFGKKVWETQAEGTQIIPLNLSRFSSGVYVYSLYMDGVHAESNKLVISK